MTVEYSTVTNYVPYQATRQVSKVYDSWLQRGTQGMQRVVKVWDSTHKRMTVVGLEQCTIIKA